uniref:WD_REPEATS_REGION domain-containing protein n=1 Tax=Steinernema glaseri TaxID=37863 RepID=A0A1I7Z5B9_9BILA
MLPFRETIVYAITPDCHLHVFRSWNDSVNLNAIPSTPIRKPFCTLGSNSKLIHFVHQ